jgi:hypothetical protein
MREIFSSPVIRMAGSALEPAVTPIPHVVPPPLIRRPCRAPPSTEGRLKICRVCTDACLESEARESCAHFYCSNLVGSQYLISSSPSSVATQPPKKLFTRRGVHGPAVGSRSRLMERRLPRQISLFKEIRSTCCCH